MSIFRILKSLKNFSFSSNDTLLSGLFILFFIVCQTLLPASSAVSPYKQTDILSKINPADKLTYQTNRSTSYFSKKRHKKDSYNKLKVAESEDTSAWSNAFNFQKSWGTQVDPRTGTLIAYTKVGSMISNLGHGPNIDLEVNYNSNSLADPDSLGQGWSWNLTHFNRLNNQLSTSQGKSFNLQKNKNGQWLPRYHKLKDIQISGSKTTHFVITYANGLRETLNHTGYEIRLEQQNGQWIKFSYLPGTHLLSTISDAQNHKIILTRKQSFIIVTSRDTEGHLSDVYLNHADGKLTDIALPEEDGQLLSVIHMNYIDNLIFRITYPTGLQKNITYNCTNAMKVPLQGYNRGLCVVIQTSVNPKMDQPEMITRYTYDKSNANEHDYLGFNSGLNIEQNSGSDTLFETPASYTYKTTEDNGITRQVRTYNKYHLLINAQIISDYTNHLLTAVHNFFCNTTQNDGCAHSTFKDLPDTYSLPLKTVTRNWGENSGFPATEITEKQYDSQGRLINTTDPYGRMKKIDYCPIKGDNSCPAEPAGWSLNTPVESVVQYPSQRIPGSENLPEMIQHNYYKKSPNINGKGYILILSHKTIKSGAQYIETTHQYYNDRQDIFKYGLIKAVKIKGTVSTAATFNSTTKNFYYNLNTNKTTKTTYEAVELKSGKLKRSPATTTSLFTNQTIEHIDAENKNITRYHYDHWGRIVQVDFGVGTQFAVSKHYAYSICPGHIQLIITGNNGLRKKVVFDGMGRQLENFTEAITDTGKVKHDVWVPVKSTNYDSYGRIVAKHSYYADTSEQVHQLTTVFEYDALGRKTKIHLPDQETLVKMYDDPDRCTVSFRYDSHNHYSSVAIVHGNILDKPTEQMVLPADFIYDHSSAKSLCKISNKESAARVSYVTYDGFGRKIAFVDPAGRKVTTTYNDAGRVINITDPQGNQFHNVYDLYGKIIQKWVFPAKSDTQYLLASAQYNNAGELLWKAGEDGRKNKYTYTEDGRVATIVMPSGDVISWQYNNIGLPISENINNKELAHVDYNPVTALPVKKRDATGITTKTYSDDGKIQQLFHIGENGYPDYHFSWNYDHNRRAISTTDITGNKTLIHYDRLGRINAFDYQERNGKTTPLKISVYDGFSRVKKINYGSGMQRSIDYNQYGQTKSVTDILADKPLSAWKYSYDKEGNIITLIHNFGYNQQAILHYQYDSLNNLVAMNCSGSSGLPLCPRDISFHGSGIRQAPIIRSQNYYFNKLNRMQQMKELLLNTTRQETASKIINYSYGYQQAPLRLKQITTQWNNITPVTKRIIYDTTGNMLVDSEGNRINYNVFNQITRVINLNGKQTDYFYDSNHREIKETTSGNTRNLFYNGIHLLNEQISDLQQETHMISYLGAGKAIDGLIHEYYEQNYKKDVTGVLTKTEQGSYVLSQQNIYSPYGMVWRATKKASVLPWYKQTFIGFNGEQTDPATGWQFLGAGHRTYNPGQRYFVSEDPAGDGYAFGSNNPVMNSDPSGNRPKWLGTAIHIMSYAGTLGMAAFHKRWANIIGTSLMAALAVTGIGISLYLGGASTPLLGITADLMLSSGSLAIASAAVPTNRGLSIASAVVGAMATVASLVMLGNAAVCGVSALVAKTELNVGENALELEEVSSYAENDALLPQSPPPDYSESSFALPSYYDRPSDIENILCRVFSQFIEFDVENRENIFHIRGPENIRIVWLSLCDNFSDFITTRETPDILLMISRETMIGKPLRLDTMVEYLDELSQSNFSLNSNGNVRIPADFFDVDGTGMIEVTSDDIFFHWKYALWQSKDTNDTGYIIRDSDLQSSWSFWIFDFGCVIHKSVDFDEPWAQSTDFDFFVFRDC